MFVQSTAIFTVCPMRPIHLHSHCVMLYMPHILSLSASSKTLTTFIASRWTDCLMVKTLQIHHFVLKSIWTLLLQNWVCERPWAERRNWALQSTKSTMGDWVSTHRDDIAPRLHFEIRHHLIIYEGEFSKQVEFIYFNKRLKMFLLRIKYFKIYSLCLCQTNAEVYLLKQQAFDSVTWT